MPSPSPTAFIVLARIRIKAGCVDDYISMSKATDDLVQQNESGTAHHVFVSDPNDPLLFTWAEAFVNDEAFLEHLNAPHIANYFKEHERLGEAFSLEFYGSIGEASLKAMEQSGITFTVYETACGFSRLQ
ncbi:MAG: antibiotic biosynthesis monooxygenase [Cyanobacteriota bacterium]|nr:antibiotic biosynthesis monooxygenase [Cyanobacteriota bacterium]